jgi:hypothetical protein
LRSWFCFGYTFRMGLIHPIYNSIQKNKIFKSNFHLGGKIFICWKLQQVNERRHK